MLPLHILVFVAFGLTTKCQGQNFDPNVEDKVYLDTIQKQLREQVKDAHFILVNQTKVLQEVARSFIESKLKENLFKAVRVRLEEELQAMKKNESRQARQDDDDDDDTTKRLTPSPPTGLLPQLSNIVTVLLGREANVTQYVKTATFFLPPDVSDQLADVASLIDPHRYTSSTPPPPTQPQVSNNSNIHVHLVQGNYPQAIVIQPGNFQSIPQSPVAQSQNIRQGVYFVQGGIQQPVNLTNSAAPAPTLVPYPNYQYFASARTQRPEAEDEENEEDSSENDLSSHDEKTQTQSSYLSEYPAIKYAVKLYNRLTVPEIPTTTEYVNRTVEYIDEDDELSYNYSSTTAVSYIPQIVQSGLYLYEGAREAYNLLQHVNKYLDRVNERFENAGYGADVVGVDV